jgi:hypothetical protein
MQPLNRQDTEDYIIDLYHNQKKTFREIQKIVRKSPRDIRSILNKVEPERALLSASSRAYQMFMEGSSPIHVAITLGLRENQVCEYYREYWNLNGLYHLNQIYEEIKDDIWSVVELHERMKSEGLSPQQVSRILKTIMTLEYKIRDLEGEQARLEVSNKQAAKTFQQLTDLIQKDRKTLEENYYVISQQKREIENLYIQKTRLENSINSIQLNNETCIKVKQMVKQEIESFVSNPRRLIRLALASLFESSRKHPGKFQALYYNMPSHLSVEQVLSQSSSSQNASQYIDSEDEDDTLLLDEAEHSYNRIVDAIATSCINEMPKDTQTLHIPSIQDCPPKVEGNHNIFDTRDLSQVNLVYNNITFQLHPGSNITNGTSSDSDGRPRKDNLDISCFLQDQQE